MPSPEKKEDCGQQVQPAWPLELPKFELGPGVWIDPGFEKILAAVDGQSQGKEKK